MESWPHWPSPKPFGNFSTPQRVTNGVVYAKRPFRDPACVLKYLARYTHRVAIANRRLVAYRDGKVTFRYKDYARRGAQRTMTLAAAEFIRRFLMHVIPDGFMRIRHYGFLANRHRQQKLATCRRLLGCDEPADQQADADPCESPPGEPPGEMEPEIRCPVCKTGRMHVVDRFDRIARLYGDPSTPRSLPLPAKIPYRDSS